MSGFLLNDYIIFPPWTSFSLNEEEKIQAQDAVQWVKNNKDIIIEKFANPKKYLSAEKPVSLFMAGSPGAGKTEMAKRFISTFPENIVHIDADEIRCMIPGYLGHNAYVFQNAATVGVEKLHDFALKNKQHFVLDTTFSAYDKNVENIQRSINKNRIVSIHYIYSHPETAWDFTKKREKIQGRNIPRESFIDHFLKARHVVNEIKKKFGQNVIVDLIEKDFATGKENVRLNIEKIDHHIEKSYNEDELLNILS